jgi:hypothetical protein
MRGRMVAHASLEQLAATAGVEPFVRIRTSKVEALRAAVVADGRARPGGGARRRRGHWVDSRTCRTTLSRPKDLPCTAHCPPIAPRTAPSQVGAQPSTEARFTTPPRNERLGLLGRTARGTEVFSQRRFGHPLPRRLGAVHSASRSVLTSREVPWRHLFLSAACGHRSPWQSPVSRAR